MYYTYDNDSTTGVAGKRPPRCWDQRSKGLCFYIQPPPFRVKGLRAGTRGDLLAMGRSKINIHIAHIQWTMLHCTVQPWGSRHRKVTIPSSRITYCRRQFLCFLLNIYFWIFVWMSFGIWIVNKWRSFYLHLIWTFSFFPRHQASTIAYTQSAQGWSTHRKNNRHHSH